MDRQFGSMRAEASSVTTCSPLSAGGRAVDAIDAGLPVRKVWLAICEEYDVPPKER